MSTQREAGGEGRGKGGKEGGGGKEEGEGEGGRTKVEGDRGMREEEVR